MYHKEVLSSNRSSLHCHVPLQIKCRSNNFVLLDCYFSITIIAAITKPASCTRFTSFTRFTGFNSFLGSQQIQFTSFALVRAYPCSWTSLWYKKFWISKWRIIRHFHFHQPKERCFFNSVGFWLKALAHLLGSTILISTIIISCYNLTIQD